MLASDVRPAASSSASSSPTSIRTRKTSTFRHVPARSTQAPIVSSPLSPARDYPRATSLLSHTLDSNKPHRPHSRLSPITLLSDSSQAPPSHDVPVGIPTTIGQPHRNGTQPDHRRTATEIANDPSPTVLLPMPMRKTPSSSPSHTPTASISPVPSPSPSSTRTSTPVRPPAPYRPGFQPKGVYRPLTDEFLEVRRSRRDIGRVEQTRLERRLEKLINLHFGENPDKKPTSRPRQAKKKPSIWELDIRSMGPSDLWRGVIQSQVAAGGKGDLRGWFCTFTLRKPCLNLRIAAEQDITPWQNDADVSQCPLCGYVVHFLTLPLA